MPNQEPNTNTTYLMIKKPTEAELEILQVLWKEGVCTVRFVNNELNKRRPIGYTTTLKLMQIMLAKGLLKRDDSSRTHVYEAKVNKEDTQKSLLDKFLQLTFGGSAMKLVMQALGNTKTTPDELKQIRAFLDDLEKEQKS